MTRSKVSGVKLLVILVNLFQILFEQVRFNYNQTDHTCRYTKVHNGNLHVNTLFEVTWQGQRSLEVKLLVIWRQIVIVIWLPFFKLLLHELVRSDYNQTWIIGALWKPSRYDALRCHMTRSKVIGGQIVTVIWRQIVIVMVALFQIAPAWTGSLDYNQTWIIGALWEPSRYDALRGHMTRSNVTSGQLH